MAKNRFFCMVKTRVSGSKKKAKKPGFSGSGKPGLQTLLSGERLAKCMKCVVNFKGPLNLFVHVFNFLTTSLL